MSEPNPELIKKYIQFQKKIQSILPTLDEIAGRGGMGESLAPAIDSLKKVATPEQDLSKVTAPHIALNSGEIQRIS